VKSVGEIMEIWEAFDLTGSFRDAGELVGCSHHTVKRYVGLREAGGVSAVAAVRPLLVDGFLPKLEEWMEHSGGKVRADVAHEKLLLLGFGVRSGQPAGRWPRCGRRSRRAGCGCTGRG